MGEVRRDEAGAGRAKLPLLLALVTVAVRAAYATLTGATFEDAFISLRYAENLAAGLGPVYNPGERVFGASSPLYVLFLGGILALRLPAIPVSHVLAVGADGLTMFLWTRWLLRETGCTSGAVGFALFFGLWPVGVQVSAGGMETSFALLVMTLALLAEIEDRPRAASCWLGVLCWLRPEGVLAILVLVGTRWRRSGRFPLDALTIPLLMLLPWILFAGWYYGSPLPNSIPAKAAAYNLHRPSILPNLLDTLAYLAPFRAPWGRVVANLVLLPCLIAGCRAALADRRLVVLPALLLAWWLYLVLPRTLLFTWYLPLLLLPAHVLAGIGLARASPLSRRMPLLAMVTIVGLSGWLVSQERSGWRIQQAERLVRRQVGLWLREHTPLDARVAMEPIGYVGYYSERRVLDEVGLVSPEMIPLNRDGAGWFSRMIDRFHPDYVVERPAYLLANETINTKVPMFRDERAREAFEAGYQAVAAFGTTDLPRHLIRDYSFVIYRRRKAPGTSRDSAALSRSPCRPDLCRDRCPGRGSAGALHPAHTGSRLAALLPLDHKPRGVRVARWDVQGVHVWGTQQDRVSTRPRANGWAEVARSYVIQHPVHLPVITRVSNVPAPVDGRSRAFHLDAPPVRSEAVGHGAGLVRQGLRRALVIEVIRDGRFVATT